MDTKFQVVLCPTLEPQGNQYSDVRIDGTHILTCIL